MREKVKMHICNNCNLYRTFFLVVSLVTIIPEFFQLTLIVIESFAP